MKRLISILAVIAMLFTFTAVPSFAEGEETTVDFTATANIAYQKVATTIVAEGDPATLTAVTDGSLETGDEVTGAFTLDLGANYQVNDITLYFGSEGASVNVYAGNAVDEANLVGTATNESATVNADGAIAQYITIESAATVTINEIYVDTQDVDDAAWNLALASNGATISNTFSSSGTHNIFYGDGINGAKSGKFNDGSLTTGLSVNYNKNTDKKVMWTIDLGGYYKLDEITFYQQSTCTWTTEVFVAHSKTSALGDYSTFLADEQNRQYKVGTTTVQPAMVTTSTNKAGTSLQVGSLDLNDEVARYITVRYGGGTTRSYYEVAVKGTPVADENVVNFRAADNLVQNATVSRFSGTLYSGSKDARVYDGNVSTYASGTGKYIGGLGYLVDLGAYYKLSEVSAYSSYQDKATVVLYSGKDYTNEGAGNKDEGKKYYDEVGELATPIATIAKAAEKNSVNGVDVFVSSHTFDGTEAPVRYLYVCYATWGTFINEIVVKGTPVSTLETGNAIYSYDSEAGTVTANLIVANGSETATASDLYFAAYNVAGALVGFTKADADLVATTGAYDTPVTFAVTEAPTEVKAFYWTDGTFVPIIAPVDLK